MARTGGGSRPSFTALVRTCGLACTGDERLTVATAEQCAAFVAMPSTRERGAHHQLSNTLIDTRREFAPPTFRPTNETQTVLELATERRQKINDLPNRSIRFHSTRVLIHDTC